MTLVGTKVKEASAPVSRSAPTFTGDAFVVGLALKGPVTVPKRVRSIAELETIYGTRQSWSLLWDWLDFYFRQGGNAAWVARYVGPAASTGSLSLSDGAGSPAVSLVVTANSPGDWANTLEVDVLTTTDDASIPADEYKLVIKDSVTGVLETSPVLATQADAVAWSQTSDYVLITLGPSDLIPARIQNVAMSDATDDRTNAGDAQRLAAANLFGKDLGPGQIAFADVQTSTGYGQLLDAGAAGNRFAVLDESDTTSKTTMLGASSAMRSHVNARWGALFGPWIEIPGLVPGTTRWIPPSAGVCAAISRNDQAGISPDQAPAGDYGILDQALDVRAQFPLDQDREDLNEGGVNLVQVIDGAVTIYGFRTLVSKISNPNWYQAANSRLYMSIAANADAILKKYVMKTIDGQGHLFANLANELTALLTGYWNDDALFGATAAEAFAVDTGDSVNTPETIAAGEIHAKIQVVMSPTGEAVELDIVKRQIGA